jgi:hypothetical protein
MLHFIYFLTCICLSRRLFRVTLEISRAECNISRILAYRDIVTLQRGHWPLLIRKRYVCTCVGADSGMVGGIGGIKAIRWGAYYYSLVLNAQPCKYNSSLRHVHDPVPSSLKMKGIHLLFLINISTDYFKHAHSPCFSSKCRLFHNATFFFFFIIHILHTGCAKI